MSAKLARTMDHTATHGRRLMPSVLDRIAQDTPNRVFAAVPKTSNVQDGFLDFTFADMARMVNFLAWWLEDHLGRAQNFETVAYIGIADARGPIVFQALVKCGFKILLLSPRNPTTTNLSLMKQTSCSKLLYSAELTPVVEPLQSAASSLFSGAVPSFQDMMNSGPVTSYPYIKTFDDAQDEPTAVLHSSGSTGLPKPIVMTHASFSVLDNEHNLPEVPGRKKRDWTMWSFEGEGRLFTVFPFFHLGGFLMFTVAAIFGNTTIVYAPPFLVPDGSLIRDIMTQQRLRALLLPPSLVEQLLAEPQGMELIKKLDFVAYSGAPLSSQIGNQLSRIIDVFSPYGATETYPQPELATASVDWEWHEFNPQVRHEMQLFDSEEGTYELVIMSDESDKTTSAVYHNLPQSRGKFNTKDLFVRHPAKPALFKYYGRKDDIITLSNGEKFNPVPFELSIQSDPSLKGALIIGNGRPQAALLLEPSVSNATTPEKIWPQVEEANTLSPGQGRIHHGMVIIGSADKPFVRTGKGTIIRRLTEDAYRSQIEMLYAENQNTGAFHIEADPITHQYSRETISSFLRQVLAATFPIGVKIAEHQDLYALGLDSIQTMMIVSSLKRSLQQHTAASLTWIAPRTVFQNPTIARLSRVIHDFLQSGATPSPNEDKDVAPQYLAALQEMEHSSKVSMPIKQRTLSTVAIIGSSGFLGSRLTAKLLSDTSVAKIYCLNRSKDARAKQEQKLQELDEHLYTPLFSKIQYRTITLDEPNLGLADSHYSELSIELDAIIFNAWKLDFNLNTHAFHPFLHGLTEVIRLAVSCARRPRTLFVSSLSSVGSLALSSRVPESPIDDPSAAADFGYARSKFAAERILTAAARQLGIPVSIARVCQLVGSAPGSAISDQSWLSALVETSKTLRCIPSHVAVVDWLRVDDAAEMLYDFLQVPLAGGNGREPRFYHVTHPSPQKWDIMVDALSAQIDGAGVVPLRDWVENLRTRNEATDVNLKALPALAMIDFFEWLAKGAERSSYATQNATASSAVDLGPIDVDFVRTWLGDV
ncbi:hypothetical protein F5Y18DRAFT_439609 [Xylariaceae sp. FL1019]|nr:hypothetical protein F5Y18DRAFT_439609 [Xylariaceae sp. FL1019]